MSGETESGKGRIPAIDLARFYAMALVFYGHFIERFMLLKNPAGFAQYKFIYSFHMVGYWLNLKLDIFNPMKGRVIGWNYLFIHEAITMYAFYLMGIYLRRRKFLLTIDDVF